MHHCRIDSGELLQNSINYEGGVQIERAEQKGMHGGRMVSVADATLYSFHAFTN